MSSMVVDIKAITDVRQRKSKIAVLAIDSMSTCKKVQNIDWLEIVSKAL